MPHKHGWGHSVVDDVLNLGVLAEPKQLILFHHDPDRDDDALDSIGKRSQTWITEHAKGTQVIVASEGLALDVTGK
jgi:phosphoribosyl 1,2-cyclic phosphodiesterase